MADSIRIIGGMSLPRRIMLASETHVAVARLRYADDANGDFIDCDVMRRLRLPAGIERLNRLPLPMTIRLLLQLGLNMRPRKLLALSAAMAAYWYFIGQTGAEAQWTFTGALAVALAVFIAKTRPWHAAEHKAVEALKAGGTAPTMLDLMNASRVSPRCGGRLALPFILFYSSAAAGLAMLDVDPVMTDVLASIIVIECVLWIDKVFGWWNVPGFRRASVLIQRYLTTSEPSERHLATAKCALDALIRAARKDADANNEARPE